MSSNVIKANPTPTGVHVIREPKEQIGRLDSANWSKDLPVRYDANLPAPYLSDESEVVLDVRDLPDLEPHILFGLIRDPRLRVKKPIPIDFSVEGSTTVAAWTEAEEFGYGSNRAEAIEDFSRTIGQLFVTLTREESSLGDDLKAVLGLLREHLEFRR